FAAPAGPPLASPTRVAATARVGTSGWIYPHWRGRFYPARLPSSRWREFLSARLEAVEINGTFRGKGGEAGGGGRRRRCAAEGTPAPRALRVRVLRENSRATVRGESHRPWSRPARPRSDRRRP